MTLTEKDRTELLGLVSGMGTAHSDAHARELAGSDPEAAAYVRQMQVIADAFKAPAGQRSAEHLSAQETDIIMEAVLARAGRGTREHKPSGWAGRLRARWVFRGMAAVLALAAGVSWLALRPRTDGPEGTAGGVDAVFFSNVRGGGGEMRRQHRFRPGDEVVTGAEFARLALPNGATVILAKTTSVLIRGGGDSLLLNDGFMFVIARDGIGVGLDLAESNLRSGTMLVTRSPSRWSWTLYEGKATIAIGDRSWNLAGGERADWELDTQTMHTKAHMSTIPSWASQMLELD